MKIPRFLPLALVGVGLLLAVGCASTTTTVAGPEPVLNLPGIHVPSPPGTAVVRPVDPPVTPHPELPPELQEAIAKLNVQVKVKGNAGGAALGKAVEGRLANAGFTIIPTQDPELTVSVDAASELFDRSGNYYLYKGTASSELRRCIDRKLLAGDDMDVKGTRKLGDKAAQTDLRRKLARRIDQWVGTNVLPNRVGIAAAELTLAMARCKLIKGRDQAEIARFIRSVQGIRGVVSCRLIGNDLRQRVYRFRTIYYPEKIKIGLSNAAARACGYRLR